MKFIVNSTLIIREMIANGIYLHIKLYLKAYRTTV